MTLLVGRQSLGLDWIILGKEKLEGEARWFGALPGFARGINRDYARGFSSLKAAAGRSVN